MPNRSSISARPLALRRRHFPHASLREWNDWRWQLRNGFKDLGQRLSAHEWAALQACRHLPTQVPPYYASLLNETDPDDPPRRSVVTARGEFERSPDEADDPLDEAGNPGMQTRTRWTVRPGNIASKIQYTFRF